MDCIESQRICEDTRASIIRGVARRKPDSIKQFYEAYSDAVFRFVFLRVNQSYEDAEEITLDTFRAALDLAATFDGRCSVFTWLCSIARLKLIDHLRRSRSRRRIPDILLRRLDDPAVQSRAVELHPTEDHAEEFLDQVLSQLSQEERDVLLLRYVEGFSVRDIASIIGRTEKATESLLSRARSKPRETVRRMEMEARS